MRVELFLWLTLVGAVAALGGLLRAINRSDPPHHVTGLPSRRWADAHLLPASAGRNFLLALLLGLISAVSWLSSENNAEHPYVSFYLLTLPIAVAGALVLGLRGGLAFLAIAHIAAWYLVLPPSGSFLFESANGVLVLVTSVIVSALACSRVAITRASGPALN
jgi:hypothetical protein